MLRKMLTLGALAVVAVVFGVGSASAGDKLPSPVRHAPVHGQSVDGFSDGRTVG
jgi:hypothetical protein